MATKKVNPHTGYVVEFPSVKVPQILTPIQGFVDFVREQGVVGLAVGLVLGTAAKELVDSLVFSFINPLIGLVLPSGDLASATFTLRGSTFAWGAFVSVMIRFISIAAVIYFIVRGLKLDRLDKKKE